MFEGGTKERIAEVGGRMIYEKGYEGTSVRSVMEEVGADVGVFYYYFPSKDALFSEVLDRFFAPYHVDFERLAKEAEARPYGALARFFEYVKASTRAFRLRYAERMHRTVRWAIREQTMTELEPYLERIIRTLMNHGARPQMEPHLTAVFLAHGVGSVILHSDADWVDSVTEDMRKAVNLLMGLDPAVYRLMTEAVTVTGEKACLAGGAAAEDAGKGAAGGAEDSVS